jgi:1,2-diacylglycerol-3-alpha-glucose alpha-1,2-glucosyltransferase
LPQLSEAGYETAKQKSIDEIGYELKEVYTKVMNTE